MPNNYPLCPCYGCLPPKRTPECHSSCKDYLDWRVEHQKLHDKRIAALREEEIYYRSRRKRRRIDNGRN